MISNLYCVRDAKTGFMTPTLDLSDASAMRNFAHAIVSSPSVLTSFTQDFDLYCLGSFDSDSGVVSSLVPPRHVISGMDAFDMARKSDGGVFNADKV